MVVAASLLPGIQFVKECHVGRRARLGSNILSDEVAFGKFASRADSNLFSRNVPQRQCGFGGAGVPPAILRTDADTKIAGGMPAPPI